MCALSSLYLIIPLPYHLHTPTNITLLLLYLTICTRQTILPYYYSTSPSAHAKQHIRSTHPYTRTNITLLSLYLAIHTQQPTFSFSRSGQNCRMSANSGRLITELPRSKAVSLFSQTLLVSMFDSRQNVLPLSHHARTFSHSCSFCSGGHLQTTRI